MKNKIFTIISVIALTLLTSAAVVFAQTLPIFKPVQGGTGTGQIPTYGQVLVGTSGGVYTPVATSTLGISTSGSASTVVYFVAASNAPALTKATADYVASGTCDDTFINAAVAKAAASSPGVAVVRLSEGSFTTCSTVADATAGVVIQGAGARSTTINYSGSGSAIKLGNRQTSGIMTNNMVLSDLQVTDSNSAATGVQVDGMGQGGIVQNVTVNGGAYGFVFEDLDRVNITNIYAGNQSVAGIRNMTGKENTWGTVQFDDVSTVSNTNGTIGWLWDTDYATQANPNAFARVTILNSLTFANTGLTTTGMVFNVGAFALTIQGSLFENNNVQLQFNGTTTAATVNASFLGDSFINSGSNSADIFQFNNNNHNITVRDSHFQQAVNVFDDVSGFTNVDLEGKNQNQGNLTNIWTGSFASRTGTDTNFAGSHILTVGLSAAPQSTVYSSNGIFDSFASSTFAGTIDVGNVGGKQNLVSIQGAGGTTYTSGSTAQADAGMVNINNNANAREALEVFQPSGDTVTSPSLFRVENDNPNATNILDIHKTLSTQFAGNLMQSNQGNQAPAIEWQEMPWFNHTTGQLGAGSFQVNSHSNDFRIESRNDTNQGYTSDFLLSPDFSSTTSGRITLFPCAVTGISSCSGISDGNARLELYGTSTVADAVDVTSVVGATHGDLLTVKETGAVSTGGALTVNGTATSTFAGPVSIVGWTLSTSTTICIYPENCQFQVQAGGGNADVQWNAAQVAVNAYPLGGSILVKHGNYTAANGGQLTFLSNVAVVGEGYGTQFNVSTTTTIGLLGNGITNSSVSNIHFNDPTVDNPAFGITQFALFELSNAHFVQFHNNWVTNSSGFDLFIKSTANSSSSDISVSDNILTANGHQDIVGGGPGTQFTATSSTITIKGNTMIQTVGSGLTLNSNVDANCVDVVGISGVDIGDNTCYGRIVYGTEKYSNNFNQIHNNTIYPPKGLTNIAGSIAVSGNDQTVNNPVSGYTLISDNILLNGNIYVAGNATSSISHVTVHHNTVAGAQSGYQTDNVNAIYLNYATDNLVDHNDVTAGDATTKGILMSNTTHTVSDTNRIKGFSTGLDMGFGAGNKTITDQFDSDTVNEVSGGNILYMDDFGSVGVGTTTPGSLFSIGATNGINFTTATTSFSSTGGINLASGCFSIGGTCLKTGVNSVSNSDTTLIISPTTGAVIASLNLAHANGWTGKQTVTLPNDDAISILSGASGSYSDSAWGRTGVEGRIVIPASGGQFSNQAIAGDMVMRLDSTSNKIIIQDGTTDAGIVVTNTKVGIGATTTPWRTFSVTGTVGFDGLTGSSGLQVGILCLSANKEVINESVACVASANRFKQNVQPLTIGLSELLKLQPVSFNWKPDYNGALQSDPNFSGTQYSLIADDVQKIDPNLVSVETASTTFEGVSYPAGTVHGLADMNHWVALIVKSIQDLNSKFALSIQNIILWNNDQDKSLKALENTNAKQQAQIDSMQAQINALKK